MTKAVPRSRILYLALAMLTIGLGLATRAFPGCVPAVFGKYPGDCLWATVVFLALSILLPSKSTGYVCVAAAVVCSLVEVLKLVPSTFLASVRHTPVGHLFLGHTFLWQNFIAYGVGIALAVCIDLYVRRQKQNETVES